MPDVGLFTAAKPLDPDYNVVIKFAVEVEGLPVVRPYVYVLIEEIPRTGYGLGGQALDLERIKAAVAAAAAPETAKT